VRHWTLALLLFSVGCTCCPGDRPPSNPDGWQSLFDGKSLGHWKVTQYGGEGKVEVKDGQIQVGEGVALSGVTWNGPDLPKIDYELELEAMKIDGSDILCGICFPVGPEHCSFVAGGWGGQVVGLSSVDGMNASENGTGTDMDFQKGRWYRFRLRVTKDKIQAWIDDKPNVNLELADRKVSLHPAMELAKPLGLATYTTSSAFRNIRIKAVRSS